MAHPKRKQSLSRSAKRRTHWTLTAPQIATCTQCGQPKLSHRICANCGYYRGRPVISPHQS
ncbi:MAG: 50S ribosomal protein L32 [Candidatus Marinimicrobia bacterium]|nr:50S ribosomal protein L32 [Candidatus Neomarinimicrobiota bacterium]MCH7938156.1 50S ribosomal protein L32 [Candidatus Neomarinimicrobiota bacterium]